MIEKIKNKNLYWIFSSVIVLIGLVCIFLPESAFAEKLYEVLKQTGAGQPGKIVKDVWQSILNVVNILVIAVLIFIAFANILRININTYSIKKVLPLLFLATIAANFSFLFCRVFVDLSNITFDLFINGSGAGIEIDNPNGEFPTDIDAVCGGTYSSAQIGIAKSFCVRDALRKDMVTGSGTFDWAVVGKYAFYTILQFVGAIFVLILAFLFYVRNYVIYFLVALSPLAFMSIILPMTKQGWSMWWTNFLRWVFLPTVSLFWLWLGSKWMGLGVNTDSFSLMSTAFAGVCYYLAITTPFKIGGGIMGTVGNLGKKAWGLTGGRAVGAGADYLSKEYDVRKRHWWSGQQASNNRFNPFRYFAKGAEKTRQRREWMEKNIEDRKEQANANVLNEDKATKERFQRQQHFGGQRALAEANTIAEYAKTGKGRKWHEGRKQYLMDLDAAEKDLAIERAKVDRDFNQGAGKEGKKVSAWSDPKSAMGETRNRYFKNIAELALVESQVSKTAEDEILRAITKQKNEMDENDDLYQYADKEKQKEYKEAKEYKKDRIDALQAKYEANDISEEEMLELDAAEKEFEKNHVATYGYMQDIEVRLRHKYELGDDYEFSGNLKDMLKLKIDALNNDEKMKEYGISRGKDGKLIIPYEITPTIKLSEDGKSVVGLTNYDDLGASGRSRMLKAIGAPIDNEVQGNIAKFSIDQMGRFLVEGNDRDFTKTDVQNVLAGKSHLVEPLARAYVHAMYRSFWSAAKAHPESLEGAQFVQKLPDVLSLIDSAQPGKTKEFAGQLQKSIFERRKLEKPGDSVRDIVNYLDSRGATIKSHGGDETEYIKYALSQSWGQNAKYRNMALNIFGADPVVGTSVPAADTFSYRQAPSYNVRQDKSHFEPDIGQIEQATNDLCKQLSKGISQNIDQVSRNLAETSQRLTNSQGGLFESAFTKISQSKIDMTDRFAREIGLVSKDEKLTPREREKMLKHLQGLNAENTDTVTANIKNEFQEEGRNTDSVEIKPDSIHKFSELSGKAHNLEKAEMGALKVQNLEIANGASNRSGGVTAIINNSSYGEDPTGRLGSFLEQIADLTTASSSGAMTSEQQNKAKKLLQDSGTIETEIAGYLEDPNRLRSILYDTSLAAEGAKQVIERGDTANQSSIRDALLEILAQKDKKRLIDDGSEDVKKEDPFTPKIVNDSNE